MTDFGNNFNELCRLCASFDNIKMDIFGEKGKERKLLDKIHACLPVKVSDEDMLPKSLCYRCIYNLENFFDFRKSCVDTVNKLESYVNETWGNALELQYKPQKRDPDAENTSINSARSEYSDSQEAPNPADFLEACMDNEPIQSSLPQLSRFEHPEQVIEVNSGSFVCPSCPQSFSNMSALIIHSKCHMAGGTVTMTGKKDAVRLFSCPVCEKTFMSKGNLSNHIKVHNSDGFPQVQDRPFRCELCSKSYTVAKHLWGHVSTAHRGDLRVTCQFCLRIFSTSQNLEDHCKTKHPNQYQEAKVESGFDGNEDLARTATEGLQSGEVNSSLPEELSNSRRKSNNPRKIQREQSVDTEQSNHSVNEDAESPEDTMVSCLLCGRMFENRNNLRKHILIGHGIDPAEVGYPDLDADELSIQREHIDESEMAESMLEAETVFCCEVCIREFNDRASLWLHMLYSHREEAATACGICLRVCSDNVSLLEHVDSCHPRETMVTDKRRYSCQICARQHDSRKKLLAHVKIHNLKDADGRALDPESMVVLNSDFYPETSGPNDGVMDDEFSMSCEICFKTFPNEMKLIKHKRNAHKDSEAMHSLNSSATYKLFFPCEMCGLSHSTRTERWRHVFSNHADEPSLVCGKEGCGKVFPTRALKQEHETSHHNLQGDSPNSCEICGKLWATRMNYWKHMMGVHSDCLPFICGVCLKVFCNVTDLSAHVKDKHYPLDNSSEYCCDICGRPYSKKSKMSRHRKIHNLPTSEGGLEEGLFDLQTENAEHSSEPGVLKCDECPTEQFLDLDELSEHRRSAHNLVPCDLCPKFYGRTSHLWKHVYKIHKTHPDITCNICLKTSASKAHLAKHYAKHHRDHAPPDENNYVTLQDVVNSGDGFKCNKCSKIFRKDHLMKQHLKHCTGPKESNTATSSIQAVNGSFSCGKCSRVFDTLGVLNKHMKSSHVTYKCEICDARKDSRTELFDHIKEEHKDDPELTCDVEGCNRMLRVKKDALKHKREHRQGYPPPSCEFCGELLQNRIKLRKHLKANHPTRTKYMCCICTVCHLLFEELQDHIKENHPSSIGKQNTCAICARKCPTKYKLETHLKTHGNEFFNCLTCYKVFRKEEEFSKHCEIHPPKKQPTSLKVTEVTKNSDAESDNEEENGKRKLSQDQDDPKTINLLTYTKMSRLSHICMCCKSSFATRAELSKHQLEDHSDLRCGTCSSYLDSDESLVTHKRNCRPKEGRLKRKAASISTSFLQKTLRFDSEDDDYEMGVVNMSSVNSVDENSSSSKDWVSSFSKASGTRKVYENDNVHSPCEHCEKTWPAKRVLWQHLIRSHKKEAGTTCGVCLKYCKSYLDLDLHLVEVHPRNFEEDDSNATCRVCGRYHNAKSKLHLHAAIHPGEEERAAQLQYDCSTCDVTFSSRGFLRKHERERHNINSTDQLNNVGDKPFENSITSDDDDSRFEGFPDEEDDMSSLKRNSIFASESISKISIISVVNSTESAVLDSSCDEVDMKVESSNISNSNEVEDSPASAKSSVCRDSFEGVVDLLKQEDENESSKPNDENDESSSSSSSSSSSDDDDDNDSVNSEPDDDSSAEVEEDETKDDSIAEVEESETKDGSLAEVEEDETKDDSIGGVEEDETKDDSSAEMEEDETKDDSLAEMDEDESMNSTSGMNRGQIEQVYHIEENVINSVKSFQKVAGLSQCSRQSISLEENSLQHSYINDTSRYITQNLTDTEIDNLVT